MKTVITLTIGFLIACTLAAICVITENAKASQKIYKIGIVDTGLDLHDQRFKHLCKMGHKDFTGTGIEDHENHGTFITGILEQNIKINNYCYVIIKYFDPSVSRKDTMVDSDKAIQYATNLNLDIINYSSAGDNYSNIEFNAIKTHPNIIFNVAAGNSGEEITEKNPVYPCMYRLSNIHCVGNLEDTQSRNSKSNFGSYVTNWEIGTNIYSYIPGGYSMYNTGTSQATAMFTSKVLNELQ